MSRVEHHGRKVAGVSDVARDGPYSECRRWFSDEDRSLVYIDGI
jgi:hypothetical protein